MNIILFFCIMPILITAFVFYFPTYYNMVANSVIKQSVELTQNQEVIKNKPIVALFIFCVVVGYFSFNNSETMLSAFLIFFAIAAYVDALCRWVPDILIYSMIWISAFGVDKTLPDGLLSIVLFCLPVALLYLILKMKDGRKCIASGDWYVFPAVGIWIAPQYSATVMVVSILVALITSRFMKNVPFLTCLFPVFIGEQLCEVYLVY